MLFNKTITGCSLLLATTCLLFSCKKNNDEPAPVPVPVPVTRQIVKVVSNETDSTLLTYTPTGKLATIVSTEGEDVDLVTYQFIYDNADKLTQITTNLGVRYQFDYEANRLKLVQNYFNLVKLSELQINYTNNQMTGTTLFTGYPQREGVITFKPTFKTVFSFDAAGQPNKTVSLEVDPNSLAETKIDEKQISQFDNYKNPLKIFEPLTLVTIYDIPGDHNPLKERVVAADGQVASTTVNNFTYNADKYPVSCTSTESVANGTPEVTKLRYYYNK